MGAQVTTGGLSESRVLEIIRSATDRAFQDALSQEPLDHPFNDEVFVLS
jgi:hypothetical protein